VNVQPTLSRSRNGGIARRFGWNSTLVRVLFVLVSILSAAFPGIVVYLILWLLMPEEGN
jgi:phage shock protein PspC (stress-responsive transcriptional regulator)